MTANGTNRLARVRPKGQAALAAALAAAALGVGACGSGDEKTIPRSDAEALLATLAEIEQKVEEGDCSSALTDATQFVAQVNSLPRDVGVETKEALREGGQNLIKLGEDECQEQAPPVPDPDTGTTGAFNFEEDD